MFGTIIVDVVNRQECGFCFAAASATVTTISHHDFVTYAIMIIAPSFPFGINPNRVFALSEMKVSLLLQYLFAVFDIVVPHVGIVAFAALPSLGLVSRLHFSAVAARNHVQLNHAAIIN